MGKLQINNITYVVQREFVGEKAPSDLIRERIRQAHCQSLPLTTPAPMCIIQAKAPQRRGMLNEFNNI